MHPGPITSRSEEHTSELQSLRHLVCRLLLEKILADVHGRTKAAGLLEETALYHQEVVQDRRRQNVAGSHKRKVPPACLPLRLVFFLSDAQPPKFNLFPNPRLPHP